MQLALGKRTVVYEVRRSSRARWARLEIKLHRGIRVVLPAAAPAADADRLLRDKSDWLLRNLARVERLQRLIPDRRFVTGEQLPYLGESLTLEVEKGPVEVVRAGATLRVRVPVRRAPAVRRALEDWYAARAEEEAGRRVADVAKRSGTPVRGVRISRARTRWGTCSPKGRLSFNWRLMLGPAEILNYLVAHELAHVDEPNHSPAFWARVARLHPAYREAERWLRRNGPSLAL